MSGMLPVAKLAVHIVSAAGVSKIVKDVIRNNTTVVTTLDQIRVTAGSAVFGSLLAGVCSAHVNEKIDAALAWYEKHKHDEPDLKIVD